MRKIQSILCMALLSTTLAGNVFASGIVSPPLFSVLNDVISAAARLFGRESCPPRQCQNCRPGDFVDEHGNCRPRED